MAGIYARVDVERGVHKAPANEVIRGITAFAQDVNQARAGHAQSRRASTPCASSRAAATASGARARYVGRAWKYINVRRLFIFVEESIDEGTQWVVFEPNDEPLWARVRADDHATS